MEKETSRETFAVLMAIVFLLLAVGIYWVLKRIGIEEGLAYPFVILLPALVYLIFADKLSSFKAGGVEATFKQVANENIKIESGSVGEFMGDERLEAVEKGDYKSLNKTVGNLKKKKSDSKIIMTLRLGKDNYYTYEGSRKYISRLSLFREFRFVVIVNEENEFEAFITRDKLSKILDNEQLGREFIRKIGEGDIEEVKLFPGVITDRITASTRNIDALQTMNDNKIDELLVTGQDKKVVGLVKRQDILSNLMLALAK